MVTGWPGGRLHRPPPRRAGKQGSRAEAEREARQVAGRSPGNKTHSLAGAKLGLRDHARPSYFYKPGQAVWRIGRPRPPPSAPSWGGPMWRVDFSTRRRQWCQEATGRDGLERKVRRKGGKRQTCREHGSDPPSPSQGPSPLRGSRRGRGPPLSLVSSKASELTAARGFEASTSPNPSLTPFLRAGSREPPPLSSTAAPPAHSPMEQ